RARLLADEEAHARSSREARRSLTPVDRAIVVDGCEAALADVERRLAEAESLPPAAGQDRPLIAALNIELSEIEALRQLGIRAVGHLGVPDQDHTHLRRLADAARRRSDSDHVRLAVALLLARERLAATTAPTRWGVHPTPASSDDRRSGVEPQEDSADALVPAGREDHVLAERVDVAPAALDRARGLDGRHAGGLLHEIDGADAELHGRDRRE